jgi:hypothetical protein
MAERNLRSRTVKMAIPESSSDSSDPSAGSTSTTTMQTTRRNPPYLPTPLEALVLAVYPIILIFGALFSLLSPETRSAPYDPIRQSHVQGTAPSYFARKDNIFNVVFVKQGWFWISVAFGVFLLTNSVVAAGPLRRVRAATRWLLVTTWWILVTQWCFGPPIIDRGFRYTGGKCGVVQEKVEEGVADEVEAFTAVACRAAGGRWSGGHDISGHVFLLVLGSFFLIQEVGWVVVRRMSAGKAGSRFREERSIVMLDGALKGAGIEAELQTTTTSGGIRADQQEVIRGGMGIDGQVVALTVVLCWWMLLMTAIYFHTWFEKVSASLLLGGHLICTLALESGNTTY